MATHIRITARRDGFRRAGLVHSNRPTDHLIGSLSEAQIEQIEADPSLKVELVDLAEDDAGAADDDVMLLGSSVLPADVELAQGVIVPLGVIVQGAHLVSGLTARAWNARAGDEIEARLNNFISAWNMVAAGAYQQRHHDSENTQGRSGTAREASHDAPGTDVGTQADQETGQADVGARPAAQSSADPGLSADQGGATMAEGGAGDDEAPSSTNGPASGSDEPQDAEQGEEAAPAEAKPAAPKPAGRKPAGKKAAVKGAGKS